MSIYKNSLTTPCTDTIHSATTNDDTNIAENSLQSISLLTYRKVPYTTGKPLLYNQTREKERFELSTLNDRFADYVEKVRYLEAQNRKLQLDTNVLSDKQNENVQRIKTIFEREILLLKQTAETLFHDKNLHFSKCQENQKSIETLKETLNQSYHDSDLSKYDTEKLEQELSLIEGNILMYTRRLAHQDDEFAQYKRFISHIQRLLLQVKNEIQNEMIIRASFEQTRQQLSNDINKLREQHQQKLNDLKQSTLILNPNSSSERAHLFKSELSNAIRRIRQDFDRGIESYRNDLYGKYRISYDEIIRQYPDLGYLFLNEHEQKVRRQEEENIRLELERIRNESNFLKQKNSDLKFHIREFEIKIDMKNDENQRVQHRQEDEINRYKLKHEKTMKDYANVLTKQISLEQEIETYRNLLEGTMKPVVDNIINENNSEIKSMEKTDNLSDTTK